MTLSNEDKSILELIEEANKQYQDYLALTEIASLTSQEVSEKEPVYSWDRPLTLVISKGR